MQTLDAPTRIADLFGSDIDEKKVANWLSRGGLTPRQYRTLTSFFVKEEEWDKAEMAVSRAQEDFPRAPEILALWGDLKAACSDWDEALELWDLYLCRQEMRPYRTARIAWMHLRQGKPFSARSVVNEAGRDSHPDLIACNLLLAVQDQSEETARVLVDMLTDECTEELADHARMIMSLSSMKPMELKEAYPMVWASVLVMCGDKKTQALAKFFMHLLQNDKVRKGDVQVLGPEYPAAVLEYSVRCEDIKNRLQMLKKGLGWHPYSEELFNAAVSVDPSSEFLLNHIDTHNVRPPDTIVEKLNEKACSPIRDIASTIALRKGEGLKFTALGGAETIGASAYVLEYAGRALLLDCGLDPNRKRKKAYPDVDRWAGDIDAIILSHGHLDHCGAVPKVHHRWPHSPVYCTESTSRFAKILFDDMLKISRKNEEKETHTDILEQSDIDPAKRAMVSMPFGAWKDIFKGCRLRLHRAGHVPGASIVELEWENLRIVYTGDFCLHDQNLTPGADINSVPREPDLLIIESTYATKKSGQTWQEQAASLRRAIIEVLSGGGKVLLPSYSIGRSQELVMELSQMQMDGVLPNGTALYIAGLAYKACKELFDVYEGKVLKKRYEFAHFNKLEHPYLPPRNSVTVASSGNLLRDTPSARVYEHLKLDSDNGARHAVFISGYLDEESEETAVRDFSRNVFSGRFERFSLSAHASHDDLIEAVSLIKPKSLCAVHWGDGDEIPRTEHLAMLRQASGDNCLAHAPLRNKTVKPCSVYHWLRKESEKYG